MVPYQGRPIIDYILPSLRKGGVSDIVLVKGYLADVLQRPGVRYAINADYNKTNMVSTLFTAEHEMEHDGDVLISYADIVYLPTIVEALVAAEGDMCVIVDRKFRELWESRMENPLSDLETLKVNEEGYIIELGKKPTGWEDIQGQFIGLIKFSPAGMKAMREHYNSLDREATYDTKTFPNMYMTSLIQSLINAGHKVTPVYIDGGWTEVDSPDDLKYIFDVSSIPENDFQDPAAAESPAPASS